MTNTEALFMILKRIAVEPGKVGLDYVDMVGKGLQTVRRLLKILVNVEAIQRNADGTYQIDWRFKYHIAGGLADDADSLCWRCSVCGRFIDNGRHCPDCYAEPPWGCDCSDCHDRAAERCAEESVEDGYADYDEIPME